MVGTGSARVDEVRRAVRPAPGSTFRSPTVRAASVVVPMMAALALGLWNVTRDDSMWRDESVTVQVAHRPFGQLWTLVHHVDAVHAAYYVLMHAVFAVWDGGLWALRLPSVLATVAAAGLVAAIAGRIGGPRPALLCGLAYAMLPITVKYAQEGRSYAIVVALVAGAVYCFVRAAERGSRRWWVLYALLLILAEWFNEFAVLALVAGAVSLAVLHVDRAAWRRFGWSAAAVVIAIVPLGLLTQGQAGGQLDWLKRPSWWNWTLFLIEAAFVALVSRTVLRRPSLQGLDVRVIAVPMFVVPSALLLVVSEIRPFYVDRYVLYGYIGFALVLGFACERVLRRAVHWPRPVIAITAAVSVIALAAVLVPWWRLTHAPSSRKDDVIAISQAVDRLARPGDVVVFLPARRREWLLTAPGVLRPLRDVGLRRAPGRSGTLEGTQVRPAVVVARLHGARRVIALTDTPGHYKPSPTDRAEQRVLATKFRAERTLHPHGGRVILYERRASG